jgi:hypothetical protein
VAGGLLYLEVNPAAVVLHTPRKPLMTSACGVTATPECLR